jgi:hypothetical protein
LTRARGSFLVLFVVALALLSLRRSLRIPDTRLHTGDLQARSSWLAMNTAISDTLMSERQGLEFVYTNRRTVRYPDGCPSPEELASYLAANQVDYVLIAPETYWQEQYKPGLSESAQCILDTLTTFQTEKRAERVFASEADYLYVFRIPHD